MKRTILLASTLAFTSAAHAQVHYPIVTHTGNVTIIDTGIHETFAGVTYDERLYIMGPWQGYNNPMVDSESAEWFPIAAPPPIVPPPAPPPYVAPIEPIVTPPATPYTPPPYVSPYVPPYVPPVVPTPVPEASTWAMLLIGFGLLAGAILKRRVKCQRSI